MEIIIELLKSVLFGIVEGVTEWLPISSTGHLILLEELQRRVGGLLADVRGRDPARRDNRRPCDLLEQDLPVLKKRRGAAHN